MGEGDRGIRVVVLEFLLDSFFYFREDVFYFFCLEHFQPLLGGVFLFFTVFWERCIVISRFFDGICSFLTIFDAFVSDFEDGFAFGEDGTVNDFCDSFASFAFSHPDAVGHIMGEDVTADGSCGVSKEGVGVGHDLVGA